MSLHRPYLLGILAAVVCSSARAQDLVHSFTGSSPGDYHGVAVAAAGDVDGDGRPDIAVGVHRSDVVAPNAGSVVVYSGATGGVLLTLHGDAAGDEFGTSIAGLGDIDGDGFDDLLVGAPFADASFPEAGLARVHSGRDGAVLWTRFGLTPGAEFGAAVAVIGDQDGDGVLEAVIGSPGGTAPFSGTVFGGVIRVCSGRTSLPLAFIGGSPEAGARFGASLAPSGDFDGDGFDDVVVGAPGSSAGASGGGYFAVVSAALQVSLLRVDGAAAGERLGASVAGLADLDGDGRPEVAAGAPGVDEVRVYGSGTTALVATLSGATAGERYGIAVASAGDVNGDGTRDFVVGADRAEAPVAGQTVDEGRFEVLSGATLQPLFETFGATRFEQLGFAVAGVGDVNGDGFDDVAAGAPGAQIAGAFNVGLALVVGGSDRLGTPYCPAAKNSLAQPAVLSGRGSLLVSDNDVELTVTGLPLNTTGFFLASRTQGFVVSPAGSSGTLCLGGDIGRFVAPGQLQSSGATGEFFLTPDLTALPTPTGATTATVGATWNFQAWYRDFLGSLGIATSNFSNGLEITFL